MFFYFIDFFPCFFYDMYTLMFMLTKLLYKSKKGVYFKKKTSSTSKKNVYLTEEDISILALQYPNLSLYTFEKGT